MNKKKGIIIGVVLFILAVAVGYALFSDTLTINGTATAKGEFDLVYSCTPGLTNEGFINADAFASSQIKLDNNYTNDSCSVNDNKITYSAELLQPEATRNFTIKITNTGSISAQLNINSGIDGKTESCIGNYDTGEFNECISGGSQALNNMISTFIVGFEKSDGTVVIATEENVDEIMEFVDDNIENFIIEPGESMYLVLNLEWTYLGNAIQKDNKTLFKETNTIEVYFTQVTN